MRTREIDTAKKFNILEKCQAFEQELLKIEGVASDKSENGIPFDLNGFYDEIFQVIIVPKYDIRVDREDYYEAQAQLKKDVIALAEKFDLHRSGDRIEDYGEHFYFVFDCGSSWKNT